MWSPETASKCPRPETVKGFSQVPVDFLPFSQDERPKKSGVTMIKGFH
jgi:hypothetical protein